MQRISARDLPRHYTFRATVPAQAAVVFDYLDDPRRLGAHMSQSSWMMAGSSMAYDLDAAQGRAIGSHIRMQGKMLGLTLSLDETVIRHEPPAIKVWKTIGSPRLLIIGHYEMGYEVRPAGTSSELTVFIRYALPGGLWWLAGCLLGGIYARWCVRGMVNDAARHFGAAAS